jgi:hypothetical protein
VSVDALAMLARAFENHLEVHGWHDTDTDVID